MALGGCSKSEVDREAEIVPVISESRGWASSVAVIASLLDKACSLSIRRGDFSIQDRIEAEYPNFLYTIGARSAAELCYDRMDVVA